jgi:hypothetical protein
MPPIYHQMGRGIDFSRLPEEYRNAPLVASALAAADDQALPIRGAADRRCTDRARAIQAAADRRRSKGNP